MKGVRKLARPLLILSLLSFFMLSGPGLVWCSGTGEHEGAEAVHGEAAHGGVSHEKFMDFVLRVENFIPLVLVLFLLLRKPVARFFGGRRDEIAQTLADFEEKKANAEARYKELEAKLDDLDAERQKLMTEYIQEGEEEKAKIIAQAHIMAERIKAQAEVAIDQEVKAAKADLIEEIGGMAAGMAEDMIKKNINDQDQMRLVEEYLDKVVQN